MDPRKIGDRAAEAFGNAWGTITGVFPLSGAFGGTYYEYEIEWDDGDFAGERYTEDELLPIPVD